MNILTGSFKSTQVPNDIHNLNNKLLRMLLYEAVQMPLICSLLFVCSLVNISICLI